MGLITEEVEVSLHPSNIKYYEGLGYEIPRRKDINGKLSVERGTCIIVNIRDLPKQSNVKVDVRCDCCNKELKNIKWYMYKRYVREDGKYYCQRCANKILGSETRRLIILKNSVSFEQWCINNNRKDVLDRWDYELNDYNPNEITYATNKKYYFKCPKGIHQSELKNISMFTYGNEGSIRCNQCNSFAQWCIDNICEYFLEKYWDNENNTVNPWKIAKSSNSTKVWIKCQEKDYHGSYLISCNDFVRGVRCGYCGNIKVHPLDSLGKLLEDKGLLYLWSEKNKTSPYEYKPMSMREFYWKCPERIHEDYYRSINDSNVCNFRCPECQYSKGEERISNYFLSLDFIKIQDKDYKLLDDVFKELNNYYIPQKEFEGLVGVGNGNLSYDFYLPDYNLLIEYQGEFHDGSIHKKSELKQSKKDFEKQIEHDRRKKDYAQNNNINLLEIWYWDFDNIEKILDEYLNKSEYNLNDMKVI